MAPAKTHFGIIPALLVGLAVLAVVYVLLRKYKESFEDGKTKVTYFYLPECPWCKKYKPEWEKFKAEVEKDKYTAGKVLAEEVDGEKDPKRVAEMKVKGFPTVFIGSKEYEGPRTAEDLLEAVKKSL